MSEDLKRAMDKLGFVKFKGAEYMTHLGYPDCIAILDEIERLKTSLSNATQQLFGGAELGGGLKARSGSMMQNLNIEAGSMSNELELARAEINRLQAERDEFWGQTHMKEGIIQRLKQNMRDIATNLRHPMKSQDELSPEDAVRLAKCLRMISETAVKTLKLLDDHGIWTGADDDIYDRVHLVVTDHNHFKKEYYKLHAALKDIHEMAAEDIRTDEASGSTWQIEANARGALGLKVEE